MGSGATRFETLMTVEEFMLRPEPANGAPEELVDGKVITMPPPGAEHGTSNSASRSASVGMGVDAGEAGASLPGWTAASFWGVSDMALWAGKTGYLADLGASRRDFKGQAHAPGRWPQQGCSRVGAAGADAQPIASSSTSNCSVALGGMTPPAPRAP